MPAQSMVVVEPFQSRAVLQALGRTVLEKPRQTETQVVIAGFPLGSCAATSAKLEPVATPAAKKLFAKWNSMGASGAWYLPPRLSWTTLKLAR